MANERDRLREAKEALVARGVTGVEPGLRSVPVAIERSWRRAVAEGVSPERTGVEDPPVRDVDERLLAAARPVTERLADDLAQLRVGVVLSDGSGRILQRTAGSIEHASRMEDAGARVGSDFSEHAIGTNGLGSVIVERAPIYVHGAEHFIDALAEVTCAGAPILEPVTRRVRGSLSLTSLQRDANPLMLALARAAVRDIEGRLWDGRDRGPRDLADAFAAASRRTNGPVIVMSESAILANMNATAYVNPANHAILWEQLVAHGAREESRFVVDLMDGAVEVRARRVRVADTDLAFQVTLAPASPGRPATARTPTAANSVPHHGDAESAANDHAPPLHPLHPLRGVHDELAARAAGNEPLLLLGGPGTGKASAARALLRTRGGYTEVDPTAHYEPWSGRWIDAARGALKSRRAVLLRHLEGIEAREADELARLVHQARLADGEGAGRLVMTVDPSRVGDDRWLQETFAHAAIVRLPDLAAMTSAIPALADRILAERGARIDAEAMRMLTRLPWPGNIAQLRQALRDIAAAASGGAIRAADVLRLFPEAGGRTFTGLQRSERAAIMDALRESGNNRAQAARLLGIGRTTLYRKLRALQIDA